MEDLKSGKGEEDIYTFLMREFEERTSSLTTEENLLRKELEGLEDERAKFAVDEARIGVLSREAETLLSVCDAKGWEERGGEIHKIKDHQKQIIDSISQKSERLKVIQAEKTRISNEVLAVLFPEIRDVCLGKEEELIEFLEGILDSFYKFGEETGATVRQFYREGLVPLPIGVTRPLRARFDEFFS